jgi:glycosyltransferase involved in cell wall biosynthesis
MKEALVISPTPSHGRPQGNTTRVRTLTQGLQRLGYHVHFLYYALDGEDSAAISAMQAAWDRFGLISAPPPKRLNGRDHFDIDDWCAEPAIAAVHATTKVHTFDLVVCNYVWMSACLEAVNGQARRLIDTHDAFAGRAERAKAEGLEPNWFWTTAAEEARGLARADVVCAIQEEEAAGFRALVDPSKVHVVGHLADVRYQPRPAQGPRLKVGYLASNNPWNVATITAFADALAGEEAIEVLVAGGVCDAIGRLPEPVGLLGRLEDVADFYASVDVVVNPTGIGTGLKIKSIEAMQYGAPLLATRSAMVGIATPEAEHAFAGVVDLANGVLALAKHRDRLGSLRQSSIALFEHYQRSQRAALAAAVGINHATTE